jgi:porin
MLRRIGVGAAAVAVMACGVAHAQQVDVGEPAPPAEDLAKPAPDAEEQAPSAGPRDDTQRRPRSHALHPRDPSPSSLAGDTQSSPPPGLIGDWQKIRSTLGARGIGLSARYASETAYNFTGGERSLVAETGQFDVGALLDLDKLVGLGGGAFQATITWRRGIDLTTTAGLGALQQDRPAHPILVPAEDRREGRDQAGADQSRRGFRGLLVPFPEPELLRRATGQSGG